MYSPAQGCDEELDAHVRRYAENREILLDGLPRAGMTDLAPADAISQSAPQHGAAADWWMLGVTMYELLHGVRPFERCPAVLVRACRASARRDGLGGSPRSPAAPAMARLPAELRVWARGFSRECNAVLTGLLDCRPAARVDDDNDNENGCAARALCSPDRLLPPSTHGRGRPEL